MADDEHLAAAMLYAEEVIENEFLLLVVEREEKAPVLLYFKNDQFALDQFL